MSPGSLNSNIIPGDKYILKISFFCPVYGEYYKVLSVADNPYDPPPEYYDLGIQLDPIKEERDQCAISVVVFSAMYLEAFIYDYAAICLGDRYVRAHLDKLDLISKWLVVPRLTTGKQINKESQAFESLRLLNKNRNTLVHLKSKKGVSGQALIDLLEANEKDIVKNTKNAINAMDMLVKELFAIDPEHPKVKFEVKSPHNKTINSDG